MGKTLGEGCEHLIPGLPGDEGKTKRLPRMCGSLCDAVYFFSGTVRCMESRMGIMMSSLVAS